MDSFIKNPVYAEYMQRTAFKDKPVTDMAGCVRQLQELGVEKAVVTGRDIETTFGAVPSNDLVDACTRDYPALFIGVYGYDPHKGMKGYKALKRAIEEKKSFGASIEPGMAKCNIDDPIYYPLYALCCDYDVPVIATAGLSRYMPGVLIESTAPTHIDKVATDFPELRLLISHGGYPWVNEILGVCIRHPNLYLDISSIYTKPLWENYVAMANTTLADRIVFASAHPFTFIDKAIQQVRSMGIHEASLEKVFYSNARQLFNRAN